MARVQAESRITKWIGSYQNQGIFSLHFVIIAVAGLFSSVLAHNYIFLSQLHIGGIEEIYTATSMIQGIVMGVYCTHVISRWWDLRVATGTVAGAISDISMLLKGYTGGLKSSEVATQLLSLSDRLKQVHILHLCEVFGIDSRRSPSNLPIPLHTTKNLPDNLVSCLAVLLAEITDLVNTSPLSDAVKFSALPALQQNLSTIRSASGDCTMILNTKHPKSFVRFTTFFTLIHIACFPIYIGSKTDWDMMSVVIGVTLFVSIFCGFITTVALDFGNPFVRNSFNIEKIVISTFHVVDKCLGHSKSQ